MEELAIIGKRLPRVDAVEKVTGRTVYGVDMRLPRLHVKGHTTCPFTSRLSPSNEKQ